MITIKQILVPVDFSDTSKLAMKYAAEFAHKFKAELHIIHAVEPVVYASEPFAPINTGEIQVAQERMARDEIAKWHRSFIPDEIKTHEDVMIGKAYTEIIRYAQEHKIDVIIIGTHGRSGFDHFLLGSTAEKVVRKSPCPVLTVHLMEHDIIRSS